MPENDEIAPAAGAEHDAAQANPAKGESTDEQSAEELSWEALDGVAGGAVGTATLTADLSD